MPPPGAETRIQNGLSQPHPADRSLRTDHDAGLLQGKPKPDRGIRRILPVQSLQRRLCRHGGRGPAHGLHQGAQIRPR